MSLASHQGQGSWGYWSMQAAIAVVLGASLSRLPIRVPPLIGLIVFLGVFSFVTSSNINRAVREAQAKIDTYRSERRLEARMPFLSYPGSSTIGGSIRPSGYSIYYRTSAQLPEVVDHYRKLLPTWAEKPCVVGDWGERRLVSDLNPEESIIFGHSIEQPGTTEILVHLSN